MIISQKHFDAETYKLLINAGPEREKEVLVDSMDGGGIV